MKLKTRNIHIILCVLSVISVLFMSCNTALGNQQTDMSGTGSLTVHFLDVGQADSILVQLPNSETMLIDAGNNTDNELIIEYLQNLNVTKIDYLIGTHPHEDHIGSLDDVILSFDIGMLFMPRITHNTKSFEDVLLAADSKGLKINTAKAGISIFNYENLYAAFFAPNSDSYDDINNYSAVLKLTYGISTFLFTGDAGEISENEMSANGYELQSDVLKVGHHGSDSSTSSEFLTAVNPSFAIISCGLNNDYGHPSDSVLQRLSQHGITVFRTDLSGTIIVKSNGENIEVSGNGKAGYTSSDIQPIPTPVSSSAPLSTTPALQEESISVTVYVTKTGEKYHEGSCSYLSKSKIPIDLSKAQNQGYTPCSRCNPPR